MTDQEIAVGNSTGKVPDIIPIIPLFEAVLFPRMVLPLVVDQEESIDLIDEAMSKDRILGLLVAKKNSDRIPFPTDYLTKIGTCTTILKMAKTEESKSQILVQGLNRFRVIAFKRDETFLKAHVKYLHEDDTKDNEVEALMSNLVALFSKIMGLSPGLPKEILEMSRSVREPGILADLIASTINANLEEKWKILEILNIKERLEEVTRLANHQVEILELGNKIQNQVKGNINRTQREYYLRHKLKAIREELGEEDDSVVEIKEYKAKIKKKNLPEEAKKEANRELNRLSRMHPSSAEYTVASTYLDWVTSLPWHDSTEDNLDIKKARKILDEDHYGLEKPKKRIIEYLAVRKLKPDSKGPILCFAGPPGTGKTSLGRSIARALGRKFFKISLGGVRDEAEIRGHRRTYVGALPGRMIQGLRRVGSNNPVFMLDEIDKVGSDFRGDPSSALLEVLDPEQNSYFSDHYLDVPFDLSKVMFITTANILDTIPPALRDRMEVLRLLGYTEDEKVKIANRYLIPRQIEENGLKPDQISFTKGALRKIITCYTREAGLRNLEREIAAICRGVASGVASEEVESAQIMVKNVHKYLGPEKVFPEAKARTSMAGVATGLAWTEAGGELMFIEATSMRGSKNLTLTGYLGDVMKESAATALSYIRSHASNLGVDEGFFENNDIHIHVPAGAIPKDGPSAGITMLAALVSLFTGRTVKKDLAMTGEITLRGQVLPVGGVKEKVLAAHRAGIKTVVLPEWNRRDLEEIPKNVKKEIEFIFADKMKDFLDVTLGKYKL